MEQRDSEKFIYMISRVPGGDHLRSIMLALVGAVLWLWLRTSPKQLPGVYTEMIFYALFFVIALPLIAMALGIIISRTPIKELTSPRKLFIPKIVVQGAVISFFVILGVLVVMLGGVLKSPFAALLTVSPIYYVVHILTNKDIEEYRLIIEEWVKYTDTGKRDSIKNEIEKSVRLVKALDYVPVIIIVLVVVPGELLVLLMDLHHIILGGESLYAEILKSGWYTKTAYLVYYVAIVGAAVVVIPPEERSKIYKKILA